MRIYRGPQSGIVWTKVDEKAPRDYLKNWQPGKTIAFNGTMEGVERFTSIGVMVEEADVLAMLDSLWKHYRTAVRQRGSEQRERGKFRNALFDIMISSTADKKTKALAKRALGYK